MLYELINCENTKNLSLRYNCGNFLVKPMMETMGEIESEPILLMVVAKFLLSYNGQLRRSKDILLS